MIFFVVPGPSYWKLEDMTHVPKVKPCLFSFWTAIWCDLSPVMSMTLSSYCRWGMRWTQLSAWANREITLTTKTSIHFSLAKTSSASEQHIPTSLLGLCQTLSIAFFLSSPFLLSPLHFRFFVHRVEKIIFISCQSLAVWSYVRQNSIKLSYTGMKLQNRPGTPKKKIIFLPFLPTAPKKIEGL